MKMKEYLNLIVKEKLSDLFFPALAFIKDSLIQIKIILAHIEIMKHEELQIKLYLLSSFNGFITHQK